ncbi:MAG TPA: SAM-dependent methyltransferase [Acholeplasmatales bacterium]|nr:MAG: SAM-dependent methyltransferase [Tenericutes bacterium GWF2_57_13]HAQ56269.1 SAM-dependent methyltransferase [Acholeplasmatales bacterium]
MDWLKHNREAWDHEVKIGNKWTVPVSAAIVDAARKGTAELLLTPTKPMPGDWFPALAGKKLLCLASGGGQQGPLFAALGAIVTVIDNSPAQLSRDAEVARREQLSIRLEEGDMRDLSRFLDESFDYVFHPISNVFCADVKPVWREAYRVLKKGGRLAAGFMNPVAYIFDEALMETTGALSVRYKIPYSDLDQLPPDELKKRLDACEPVEFGHSLADQIGGQTAAGFHLIGFYEDLSGWDEPLDRHIPVYLATLALKPAGARL